MAETVQPYTHQDFPRFVFSATKVPGAQEIKTDTGIYYGRQVATQDEMDALDGDWFNSPDEAAEAAGSADELAEAKAAAEAAGIKVDSRWGLKRIKAELAKVAKQ